MNQYRDEIARLKAATARILASRAEFEREMAKLDAALLIDPEACGFECHAGPVMDISQPFNPHDYLDGPNPSTQLHLAERARDRRTS